MFAFDSFFLLFFFECLFCFLCLVDVGVLTWFLVVGLGSSVVFLACACFCVMGVLAGWLLVGFLFFLMVVSFLGFCGGVSFCLFYSGFVQTGGLFGFGGWCFCGRSVLYRVDCSYAGPWGGFFCGFFFIGWLSVVFVVCLFFLCWIAACLF